MPNRMSEDMQKIIAEIMLQYIILKKHCQIEMSWCGSLDLKYFFQMVMQGDHADPHKKQRDEPS